MFPKLILLLVTVSLLIESIAGQSCLVAPPSPNYIPERYGGFWFEIGKIQTAGGAFFERNCVCTSINVTYVDAKGDALCYQGCRSKTPEGPLTLVVGNLTSYPGQPGKFNQTLKLNPDQIVSYTVVQLSIPDDSEPQYAVEYDCGGSITGVNYCLHFMSRTPTMDSSTLSMLVEKTNYLNTQNLPLHLTPQTGCPVM